MTLEHSSSMRCSWVTGQTPRCSLAAKDETERTVEEIKRRHLGKTNLQAEGLFFFFLLSVQIGFKAYRTCWDPQLLEMSKRLMTAIILLSITHSSNSIYRFYGSNLNWGTDRSNWVLVTFHRFSRKMLENSGTAGFFHILISYL